MRLIVVVNSPLLLWMLNKSITLFATSLFSKSHIQQSMSMFIFSKVARKSVRVPLFWRVFTGRIKIFTWRWKMSPPLFLEGSARRGARWVYLLRTCRLRSVRRTRGIVPSYLLSSSDKSRNCSQISYEVRDSCILKRKLKIREIPKKITNIGAKNDGFNFKNWN